MTEKKEKQVTQEAKTAKKEVKVFTKPIDVEKADLYYSCCRKTQRLTLAIM